MRSVSRQSLCLGGAIVALSLAACAHSGPLPRIATCNPGSVNAAMLASGPVFLPCEVDHPAVRLDRDRTIPPNSPPTGDCYSALLEFVVDTTGTPDSATARVVRSTGQGYAAALLASLPHWRYAPARKDGRLVRQLVRQGYAWHVPGPRDFAAWTGNRSAGPPEHCEP